MNCVMSKTRWYASPFPRQAVWWICRGDSTSRQPHLICAVAESAVHVERAQSATSTHTAARIDGARAIILQQRDIQRVGECV